MPIADPDRLADLVKVEAFTPLSYDLKSGIVSVPDSENLSPVYANLLFIDGAGVPHQIHGGIVNDLGKKQFIINKGEEVSLTPGAEIKSSLDFDTFQRRGNVETAQIILGVHSKDPLFTKYLYTLVKYFMLSRRDDLIARGLQTTTYNGSDFSRQMEYEGDMVFTRFFHIHGMLQNHWRSDKVQLLDSIDVNIQVEKDRLGNEPLNLTDSTIKVRE
jgi:hypothetical protein